MSNLAQLESFSDLRAKYLTGGFTRCLDSWRFENIVSYFDKMYYIVDGEFYLKIDGREYIAQKGQMFFLPCKSEQTYYHINDNHVLKYWIHGSFLVGETDIAECVSMPDFVTIEPSDKLEELFRNLLLCSKDITIKGKIMQQAYMLELLAKYVEKTSVNEKVMKQTESLTNLMQYIEANLDKNLTLKSLSEFLHFHPNYFVTHFKKNFGLPPMDYLKKLRIEKAMTLLQTTTQTVSEIAASVGYKDNNYFSRVFKQLTGFSPSEYREFASSKPNEHFVHGRDLIETKNVKE